MICRIAVVALVLLAGCPGFKSEGQIQQISRSVRSKIVWGHPTRNFLTVDFAMPENFRVNQLGDVTVTDTAGRDHPITDASLSETNGIQRVSVTYEIMGDSSSDVIRIEEFDVDLGTGRVTRRPATP